LDTFAFLWSIYSYQGSVLYYVSVTLEWLCTGNFFWSLLGIIFIGTSLYEEVSSESAALAASSFGNKWRYLKWHLSYIKN